jgi:type IV secretory pathway VirB10-like protein
MSNLVDTRLATQGQIWLRRVGVFVGIVAFVALVVWLGMKLSSGSGKPRHQVAKIALLPDTPPPPPPPPPPEKAKVEPKMQTKQQQQEKQKETPPEPQIVKMEGAAGDGPSPFAAGEVKNDYIGGDIGNGEIFQNYVGRVAQFIQDELTRRKAKVKDARMLLWLEADGTVQRFEVRGAAPDVERQIRTAMADFHRMPQQPPQGMPMPMGLEISER